MAKDLNRVTFTGNLGADPEMRYAASGSAVTNFRVACNRSWKDRDGAQHEETEWFRVVAWDKLGEICNEYLAKGTKVYIEGRLQTRKYTDRDNIERTTVEIVAQDMIILSSKGERGSVPDHGGADTSESDTLLASGTPHQPVSAARQAPARQAPARQAVSRNAPRPFDDDDDIPF